MTNIKLSPLFSDGTVLQRGAPVKIRGECLPGESVKISFLGNDYSAGADGSGRWLCPIGEFPARSEPCVMTVSSGGETVTVRDILIGDVWLCSGQSNMELMLNRAHHNYPDEITLTNPLIRQLKIPQMYNFNGPSGELSDCAWEKFSPETAMNFTAAGYFFAKKLHERYEIPIGLLACAVGGTPAAAWMSREMLADFPALTAEADECADGDYIEKTLNEYEEYSRDYHRRLDEKDEGLLKHWASAAYNDADWDETPVFAQVNQSGAYWYRKTVDVPRELWGKPAVIFLGTAVDMDEVFVNGEKIGVTYYRYPPREYSLTLPEGRLTVAVRLLCFNGFGGFTPGKNLFIAAENRCIDMGGAWKRRLGTEFENQKGQTFFAYKPTGLFNGMISPLAGYGMKGVIWYQGESDTGNPDSYARKLTELINGWRKLWGNPKLPFLFTQLANYEFTGGADWDLLREQQKKCLSLPNTGLAAAYDIGEYNDLHPQNKRDIGERLARLAMRAAYGEKLPPNMFEMYNI